MKTLNIHIKGRVQGVWFRASAQEEAERLGVNGWTCNESDGTVTILAQGEENVLTPFIDWCHKGPSSADVQQVKIDEVTDAPVYKGFKITH